MDDLEFYLIVACCAVAIALALMGLRISVLARLGLRNIARRRVRTLTIVFGLMIGAATISSAFVVGDTMEYVFTGEVYRDLHTIDEIVYLERSDGQWDYYNESAFLAIEDLADDARVDGIVPAVITQGAVFSFGTGLSEPSVNVLGLPGRMDGFGTLRDVNGEVREIGALGAAGAYLNLECAEELDVKEGDRILLVLAAPMNFTVEGVVSAEGLGGYMGGANIFLSLDTAKAQTSGRINAILVSNHGGVEDGAALSGAVSSLIRERLDAAGWGHLKVDAVKQERVEDALSLAEMLTEIFLILGLFCVVAGLMLVVNIFVLLAEERKAEMGVSRAIGMKRLHLMQTFVYEGVAYAGFAALAGALTGVILAYVMIEAFNSIVSTFILKGGQRLIFKFEWGSVFLGFGLGFLVTFLTVVLVSWRVSRLNIVRAIRDIPEPAPQGITATEAALGIILLLTGVLGAYLGLRDLSLVLVSASPCLLMLGAGILAMRLVGSRAAFTAVGVGIIFWLLLPISVVEGAKGGIEVFVTTGVLLVTGAVLIVIFNSKPLLFVVINLLGRRRNLTPVLKTAVSYPMKKPLRTALTLTMFALVIFTVTVISFMSEIQTSYVQKAIWDQSGGYQVIGYTASGLPLVDAEEKIANSYHIPAGVIAEVHEACVVKATILFDEANVSYAIGGFEEEFFHENTFTFREYERRFSSPQEVWEAVLRSEGIVMDGSVAEAVIEHGKALRVMKVSPGEVLRIQNITGGEVEVRVLGILEEAFLFNGIFTTEDFVHQHFMMNRTNLFFFKLAEGVDASAISKGLEKEFWMNGMETFDVMGTIEQVMQTASAIMRLLQVYLSLGLIVGIAGLGVVSLRAVVERRQEIGMLRAIGFSRGMILRSFLIEISFVAVLGIAIGVLLGTALSYDMYIEYFKEKTAFRMPWENLLLLTVLSYFATLLATSSLAVSASRTHPAEALRVLC